MKTMNASQCRESLVVPYSTKSASGEEKDAFENNFTCIKTLQKAIFGNVLLCDHKRKKKKRAVKVLDKKLIYNRQSSDNLPVFESAQMEIFILRELRKRPHPHVLCLAPEDEQFEDESMIYVVTPYCEDGELFTKCAEGQLSHDNILALFMKIMQGVDHLHKCGFVHNDISLENILLRKTKNNGQGSNSDRNRLGYEPVLCDFGLCSRIGETSVKRGKIQYQAPEVIFGDEVANSSNPKSDVYSLGVVLFILIFKYPPYDCPHLKDPRFAHIQAGKMKDLLCLWNVDHLASPAMIDLLQSMLWQKLHDRPSLQSIMEAPLFVSLNEVKEQDNTMDIDMDLLFQDECDDAENKVEDEKMEIETQYFTPKHKARQPNIYSSSPDNVFDFGLMQNRIHHS